MCLSKITVKRKLKKPMVVWGIVEIIMGEEISPYAEYSYQRINHAKHYSSVHTNEIKHYKVGFHKFISKKDCDSYLEYLKRIDASFGKFSTVNFIIPSGVTVQYGRQRLDTYWTKYSNRHYKAVVSPVLINPRIKPELSNTSIGDILDNEHATIDWFETQEV